MGRLKYQKHKQMNIHPIIYNTTRGIYSVEDKLSIASLILFSWKLGNKTLSKLLYTDDHKKFIDELSNEYKSYNINLSVKLEDKQIYDAFIKTIEKVREKYDSNGFLKALYEGDDYAVVIDRIIEYEFNINGKKTYKSQEFHCDLYDFE